MCFNKMALCSKRVLLYYESHSMKGLQSSTCSNQQFENSLKHNYTNYN